MVRVVVRARRPMATVQVGAPAASEVVGVMPVEVAAVDPDGSGVINVQDINPFVAMLAGSGAEMAIPEPTGACVLLLAAGGVLIRRG